MDIHSLKSLPSLEITSKYGQVLLVLGLIIFLAVIGSAVLLVCFSRDSINAEAITEETWNMFKTYNPKISMKNQNWLTPNCRRQYLSLIWQDRVEIQPVDLVKGGQDTWEEMRRAHKTTRGIVLAAGGYSYFTSAFILIRQLRQFGCKLPIELFYKKGELDKRIVTEMLNWDVICYCFEDLCTIKFVGPNKFSIKVLAMYLSTFEEILYLDADNNVLKDPTFLFEDPLYTSTGALFWPDYWHLNSKAPCYAQFHKDIKPQINTFQQESGQLVINKTLYNDQLWQIFRILENNLAHLFPAPYNHGDKDIFHITLNATGKPFHFIPHRVKTIGQNNLQGIGMGQSAPDGSLLFLHQNTIDWCDRPLDQKYWLIIQEHTHPKSGWVESGTWCLKPLSLVKTFDFREIYGAVEDMSLEYLKELRQQEWYRDFFSLPK